MTLTTIAFDADDTLWHNENFYKFTEKRFAELLSAHTPHEVTAEKLLEVERKTLAFYGYGAMGFTLSMIETAQELIGEDHMGPVVKEILQYGHEMLTHPVELLPNVRFVLDELRHKYRLIMITKGDLFHQERKVAASGLADYFDHIEIVSEKSADLYRNVFTRHADGPAASMMIGNSVRSDVAPAIEAGAWGVHVPFATTWALERMAAPESHPRFRKIDDLGALPALLDEIGS